jgi:hypothetical protein
MLVGSTERINNSIYGRVSMFLVPLSLLSVILGCMVKIAEKIIWEDWWMAVGEFCMIMSRK